MMLIEAMDPKMSLMLPREGRRRGCLGTHGYRTGSLLALHRKVAAPLAEDPIAGRRC
jgi:hypothetical protein